MRSAAFFRQIGKGPEVLCASQPGPGHDTGHSPPRNQDESP